MLKSTTINCASRRFRLEKTKVLYTLYMRSFIRALVFSYIALILTQNIIGGFDFGNNGFILVLLALTLLAFFVKPILKVIGLPDSGVGFIFLNFLLTLAVFFALTAFLGNFSFTETNLPRLNILSFMLPSKHLNSWMSGVFSALVYSLFSWFFHWLSGCKK